MNGCTAAAAYLQDERVAPGHVLLRRHVEEGEANAQAVKRVVGVSLDGLGVLTCRPQSLITVLTRWVSSEQRRYFCTVTFAGV